MNNNWARDLMGGYTFGNIARDKFDTDVAKRKAEKVAGTIASEQDKKLFKTEDKGGLSGWMYDVFGIGDPPTKTPLPKTSSPATSGTADPGTLRDALSAGANALANTPTSAPKMLDASYQGEFTPNPTPQFAQATPLVVVPLPSEQDISPQRRTIRQVGLNGVG